MKRRGNGKFERVYKKWSLDNFDDGYTGTDGRQEWRKKGCVV